MDCIKSVGDKALLFVLQFYSEPSQYFWTDDCGDTHVIHQGEGGEQGDALMPMLYALGQHGALFSLQDFLLPHEQLFAYLDDINVVCLPDWVGPIFKHLQEALDQYARIQVHLGKTQVWNRGGHYPPACQQMQEAAAHADPQAGVWRREGPPAQQGVRVLGILIGHEEFVQAELRATTEKHQTLVERIPLVQDLQSARLLLLFCANTHATFSLRGVPPAETEQFAAVHYIATWQCFTRLLGISGRSDEIHDWASLPFHNGWVRIAERHQNAGPCSLGQLGRQSQDDPQSSPRSRSHHGEVFVWFNRHATFCRRCFVSRLVAGIGLQHSGMGKIFPLLFLVHWLRWFQVCWPFQRRGGNMTLLWFWSSASWKLRSSRPPLQLDGPCSGRKEVLSLASRSPLCPSPPSTGSSLTCSGSSFLVAFTFLSHCPPASAGVAVHSTALATTAQVARGQGSLGGVASHWSLQ